MKRIGIVLLALVMVLSLLAGCGGGNGSSGSTPAPAGSTPAPAGGGSSAPAANTDPITVWVHPYLGAERAEENEAMFKGFAEEFTAETGVAVDVQVIPWANRDQKMLMAFSANKGPDVVYMITDHLSQFAAMGVLAPLDEYITDDIRSDYVPSTLEATTVNGNIYGIPMLTTVNCTAFNVTLLEEIGWDMSALPSTWEDIELMGELAKAKGKYALMYEGGENGNLSFYPYMWQAGGNVLDADGNVVFDSPETRKALTTLADWYNKGYMPTDSLNLSGANQVKPMWESGNVCMWVGDGGIIANYCNGTEPLNFEIQISLPTKDKEQVGFGTVGAWAVATTSTNQAAAAAFIVKMTEAANMQKFLEASGFMPPRQSLFSMYDSDPNMKTMVESTPYLRPGVVHPAGRTITTTIIPPLVQAIMMGEDIDAQMANAVTAIEQAVTDSMAIKTE